MCRILESRHEKFLGMFLIIFTEMQKALTGIVRREYLGVVNMRKADLVIHESSNRRFSVKFSAYLVTTLMEAVYLHW
jgi:hypothetical protein